MQMRGSRPLLAAAVGLVGALVVGIAAAGGKSDADPTIHACAIKGNGLLRIIHPPRQCRRWEVAVNWNTSGEPGLPGPAGPAGPPGPDGAPGPKGEPGASLEDIADLEGLTCAVGDAAGAVAVDVSAGGTIELRCEGADEPPPPPPTTAALVINEIDYDQVGTDAGGFVEIQNAGDGVADLSTLALVLVNGGDSNEYDRVALSGTLAAGGYLVVDVDAQNGAPDGVALIDVVSSELLDALSYEGEIRSAVIGGVTYDLVEGTALAASVADSNTADGSLIRNPDGTDTDDAAADWAFTTTPTKGAANLQTS